MKNNLLNKANRLFSCSIYKISKYNKNSYRNITKLYTI